MDEGVRYAIKTDKETLDKSVAFKTFQCVSMNTRYNPGWTHGV